MVTGLSVDAHRTGFQTMQTPARSAASGGGLIDAVSVVVEQPVVHVDRVASVRSRANFRIESTHDVQKSSVSSYLSLLPLAHSFREVIGEREQEPDDGESVHAVVFFFSGARIDQRKPARVAAAAMTVSRLDSSIQP